MSERYLDALWRARHALDAIESWLATLPEQDGVTIPRIQREIRTPSISYAQAALVVNALVELGILEKQPGLRLNRSRLLETEPLRTGMRQGIEYTRAHLPSQPVHFLVALPTGLSASLQEAIAAEASDLRAGLIGLLAEAQEHLLLASPFWDETTMTDLGNILERRLNGGVRVDLLIRSLTAPKAEAQHFTQTLERLAQHPACRVWTWNTPLASDHFGTQTFHFKCIVADHGKQAYLGSANFTMASLRSRMELGVLLDGEDARALSRLVTQTLGIAQAWGEKDRKQPTGSDGINNLE
jgi:phosphatidylserine/phosphatidylglycerophosphate/cardiolipin synthase-like enzyme